MRRFDGIYHNEKCDGAEPSELSKFLPFVYTPEGTQALLDALALAEKILLPFCVDNGEGKNMFAPVVGLLAEGNETFYTKEAVIRAMSRAYDKSGSRFFYNFSVKRGYARADFIDEHWDTIEGSTCAHCDNLPHGQDGNTGRIAHSMKWKPKAIARIRANCESVYRPLKAAMKKELQFVRHNPQPAELVNLSSLKA
ncbi:hypothetical protein JG687_00007943 [Phytophthora cactorum]|uniref:Uncharacterized protein n=1 Tax=Phytophthora cactorum TaxID=29920 RepID=A0A8T1UIW3_9STRA|nr:hypothetical protein PC120_g14168 [Phytophthora cactorum]KAG3056242.1 hypothetical protein PC121_g15386 [Phytophthora cactorum]KAG4046028.1 hypothetical protein PC123_g18588 [Phytophthora cactorum]KAG6960947.1 hypothetical protein JG687_00007943 [Phytophthora cactorum]